MAAVEGGANWIDASVIGIGDRGGCVALEEAAALFEMYGIETGIKLDALYELAQDYLKAGLLDRAEELFAKLKGTSHEEAALRYLLEIYEQEKDWLKAIDTAQQLEGVRAPRNERTPSRDTLVFPV